jgi:hypothetical protein
MRVEVDGRVTSARLFEAGETQRVTASRQVSIRAGNAGGVFVSLNGGDPSALGRAGQAVTRSFTREGRGTPASAPPLVADAAPPGSTGPPPDDATGDARAPTRPAGIEAQASVPETVTRAALATETPSFAPRPDAPLPQPAPAAASPHRDVSTSAQSWLDAYARQDREAMAAYSDSSVSVTDERPQAERAPSTAGIRRELSDVNIQLFGDSAIFTARITEQAAGRTPSEAYVSQIWNRRDGVWRLSDVRIVSRTTLDRVRR